MTSLVLPTTFAGRYRLNRVIGEGGMGQVFEATDTHTGHTVALKMLKPGDPSPLLRRYFDREIQLLQRLSHPALLPVLDCSAPTDDTPFYTMPVMAGNSLADRLGTLDQPTPLTPAQAGPIFLRVAESLKAMHENGVIHRDVKPANVLFDEAGLAYLADLGLAREFATPTQTTLPAATLGYASPEQLTGHPLSPASDVFSLAALMYVTLTGHLPFVGFGQVSGHTPTPASQHAPHLPAALDEVLTRALHLIPTQRPPTPTDLYAEVHAALAPTLTTAPAPHQPPAPPTVPTEALDHLRALNLAEMFVALGWSQPARRQPVRLSLADDAPPLAATPLAESAGVLALVVNWPTDQPLPTNAQCRALYRQVPHAEKLLIVRTPDDCLWYWEDVAAGRRLPYVRSYRRGQPVDAMVRVLAHMQVTLADLEAGTLTVLTVAERLRRALAADKMTKKFYRDYEDALAPFIKSIKGLSKEAAPAYASTVLNRLMFIYFLQAKGLMPAPDFLQSHLRQAAPNTYYQQFLRPLWFEALGQPWPNRPPAIQHMFAHVPYLNGGLFAPTPAEADPDHPLNIGNEAFAQVFAVLDRYHWHLDERPSGHPNEINPDVLGYIFEKHINQKQMGAYYTKEDITNYIARNTLIPRLLDKLADLHPHALTTLAARLNLNPEKYLFGALTQPHPLPTETPREHAARLRRAEAAREALLRTTPTHLTRDLVTWNVNVEALLADWLADLHDPLLARAFYFEGLQTLSVLDPTVGSGAFLFAALNILYPLYEACLRRFEALRSPKYPDFDRELARVRAHPNRAYFILKSIMLNNLYGVDVMPEAVEICKLRLFLKLAAALAPNRPDQLEPLPDIDFNVRAGNALVGFATEREVEALSLFSHPLMDSIRALSRDMGAFRALQTQHNLPAADLRQAKASLAHALARAQTDLDKALASHYGARSLPRFVASHQPFHWLLAFYPILAAGGFDVIIGNPPYVEYKEVKDDYQISGYDTESCGNLYAFVVEKSFALLKSNGKTGMIIPHSAICTDRMLPLQKILIGKSKSLWLSTYDIRPSKLFDGVDQRLAIFVSEKSLEESSPDIFSSRYYRWQDEFRRFLFETLEYANVSNFEFPASVPKIFSETEVGILQKLSHFSKLRNGFGKNHVVYFHNAPRYWIRAMNFTPFFSNERHGEHLSTQVKSLVFDNELDSKAIVSILSSSLFYWWFLILSDCRHLNVREIELFHVGLSDMDFEIKKRLSVLCDSLMLDLKKNKKRKTAFYATTGKVEYDEFYPRHSKPIIDEIDRVLGAHYGLSEAEVDFIIHYDLKYRLGGEGEEG